MPSTADAGGNKRTRENRNVGNTDQSYPAFSQRKEYVAVLTMLCKKNGAVTHVESDFLFVWALHPTRDLIARV